MALSIFENKSKTPDEKNFLKYWERISNSGMNSKNLLKKRIFRG